MQSMNRTLNEAIYFRTIGDTGWDNCHGSRSAKDASRLLPIIKTYIIHVRPPKILFTIESQVLLKHF